MTLQEKIIFILQNHKKQAFGALLFIITIILIKNFGISHYLSLDYLHTNTNHLHEIIEKNYCNAIGIYLLSYIAACALSIPGSTFFLTASGFLFGTIVGFFLAVIGATIGGLMLYLSSRYMIGSWVQQYFKVQLTKFNNEISHHGFFYLLMVRLIGILPFFVVNVLSGITLIPPFTFVWTTCVGMMPFALTYAFIGSQLAHMKTLTYTGSPAIITALSIFFIFKIVLVPLFYKKIKHRRARVATKRVDSVNENR